MYSTLPSATSIRLLKFQHKSEPGEVQASAEVSKVSISLQEFELNDAPSFKALSYTWGPPYHDFLSSEILDPRPVFSRNVLWNGQDFPVTENLHDALVNFIERSITGWLWIDAVCINQEDIAERGVQVALMGNIYSSAEEVLVWLGKRMDRVEHFVWASTTFVDLLDPSRIPDYISDRNDASYTIEDINDRRFHEQLGISDPRPRLCASAYFYSSCRWFSRVWIAQEVLLGKKVRMFCGEAELSFARMLQLARVLVSTGWLREIADLLEKIRGKRPAWLEEPWRWYTTMKVKENTWNGPRPDDFTTDDHVSLMWLMNAIDLVRVGDCFDDRDKIYAALGIAEPYFEHRPIAELIKPNYNLSVSDLYTQVTKVFLESWRDGLALEFLAAAGTKDTNSSLESIPSWAVDFSRPVSCNGIAILLRNASAIPERVSFDPSHLPAYQLSMSTLTCSAALIDEVVEVIKIDLDDSILHISLLKFCNSLPKRIRGVRRFEVLWRTLMCDVMQQPIRHPAPAEFELGFLAVTVNQCVQHLQAVQEDAANVLKEGLAGFSLLLNQFELSDDSDDTAAWDFAKELMATFILGEQKEVDRVFEGPRKLITPLRQAIIHSSNNRSLFFTASGLLGLGPSSAQKGDLLSHLCTAHVPYLLRDIPQTPNYSLVGECYVHGIMKSSLLHDCHEEEHRSKTVKIHIV